MGSMVGWLVSKVLIPMVRKTNIKASTRSKLMLCVILRDEVEWIEYINLN